MSQLDVSRLLLVHGGPRPWLAKLRDAVALAEKAIHEDPKQFIPDRERSDFLYSLHRYLKDHLGLNIEWPSIPWKIPAVESNVESTRNKSFVYDLRFTYHTYLMMFEPEVAAVDILATGPLLPVPPWVKT